MPAYLQPPTCTYIPNLCHYRYAGFLYGGSNASAAAADDIANIAVYVAYAPDDHGDAPATGEYSTVVAQAEIMYVVLPQCALAVQGAVAGSEVHS